MINNALQVKEAVNRMRKLKMHPNAINEFINGKLNLSERGILYWLDDTENAIVRNWERKTGNIVYHVIKNNLEFGICYSFLYVSKHEDEWERDNNDIAEGYAFVYVYNSTDEMCSEYGSIGIKPCFGGVVRTA